MEVIFGERGALEPRVADALEKVVYRGQIWEVDLGHDNVIDSEQDGYRPCIVLQNDIGNRFSPTVIVACITSKLSKAKLPTHVECALRKDSLILLEQVKTVSKRRLKEYVTTLSEEEMEEVDKSLRISLGLN